VNSEVEFLTGFTGSTGFFRARGQSSEVRTRKCKETFGAKRSETWVFYWASEALTANVSAVGIN